MSITQKQLTQQRLDREAYARFQKASGIASGDLVKVLRSAQSQEQGWPLLWLPRMDRFVGRTFSVSSVTECGVRFVGGSEIFPFFVLEVISKAPQLPTDTYAPTGFSFTGEFRVPGMDEYVLADNDFKAREVVIGKYVLQGDKRWILSPTNPRTAKAPDGYKLTGRYEVPEKNQEYTTHTGEVVCVASSNTANMPRWIIRKSAPTLQDRIADLEKNHNVIVSALDTSPYVWLRIKTSDRTEDRVYFDVQASCWIAHHAWIAASPERSFFPSLEAAVEAMEARFNGVK